MTPLIAFTGLSQTPGFQEYAQLICAHRHVGTAMALLAWLAELDGVTRVAFGIRLSQIEYALGAAQQSLRVAGAPGLLKVRARIALYRAATRWFQRSDARYDAKQVGAWMADLEVTSAHLWASLVRARAALLPRPSDLVPIALESR